MTQSVTRSLARGLGVLEVLAWTTEDGLGASAISQRVGLDKATVTRLLRTLVEMKRRAAEAITTALADVPAVATPASP